MSVDVWRQVANGEEACNYAYGVLAARLPIGAERDRAVDLAAAHARARDRARAELAALDADPPVPAAFQIPFPVEDAAAARRLAALVEGRLVDVYCRQIPEVEQPVRGRLATAAAEASARSVGWGGSTAAFPGNYDAEPTASSEPTTTTAPSGPSTVTPSATAAPVSPATGDGATID